ncbi:MAG: protein arginine kinase [Candidatus Omnitrophota bacterium]|nr:protein arginine kinase [Candidatus Omnitrophota bacterium]
MGSKALDELLKQPSEWLRGAGPVSDIVISSRVRLARNLEKYPFTARASKASQDEVLRLAKESLGQSATLKRSLIFEIKDLDEIDRQFLVERHLVSREQIVHAEHKAVAIGQGEVISVMINEEDHLRLQVMQSGLNLQDAWSLIDALDDELSETLPYAYSSDWGYLTSCPTNTGTGLRASVMAHLPSLVLTKQINKVLHTITRLGLTARGLYGEGTEASGNFFQISNQVALGRSEEELIENIERILKEVIHQEQTGRESLMANNRVQLEDRIWRAFGLLRHAKTVSSSEALDLLSAVRLGVDLGLMNGLDRKIVNEMFIFSQPAHLQKLEGKALSAKERDTKRAQLIRSRLGGQS